MKLLQISRVAGILDVTVPRAYELARSGVIPTVRIGRQVRVSADALLEWIEAGGTGLAGLSTPGSANRTTEEGAASLGVDASGLQDLGEGPASNRKA